MSCAPAARLRHSRSHAAHSYVPHPVQTLRIHNTLTRREEAVEPHASGEPINDSNVAQDEFEREGISKSKSGKNWHESIVSEKGKRHLRVVTPIPVVLGKCTMCHENYKNFKQGEPIGAISYNIPIR